MFEGFIKASDARTLIVEGIEARSVKRRADLVERLTVELRTQINARKFAHKFYANTDLWDNLDQAATELTEIGRELEKLGYATVITISRTGMGHGRSNNPHTIAISW